MESAVYLLKILYQPLMVCILFLAIRKKKYQTKSTKVRFSYSRTHIFYRSNHGIGILQIILLSSLQGLYSVICGPYRVYLADREYYAIRFANGTYNIGSSVGIYNIQKFLNNFSHDPYVFFFVSGCVFLVITIVAYNESEDASNLFFAFLGASQYLMFGCYQIKQSMAMALSGLAIIILLKGNSKIIPGLLIVLAIAFHEVAWIMIPIYFIILLADNKVIKVIMYVTLFIIIFFFKDLSRIMVGLISRYIPSLSLQMVQYVDNTRTFATGSSAFISILKGMPFYFVTGFSILNRNELRSNIKQYNAYFLISIFVSFTSISS